MRHECEAEQEGDHGVAYRCTEMAVGKWHGMWFCSEHLVEQMKESSYTPQPDSETFS